MKLLNDIPRQSWIDHAFGNELPIGWTYNLLVRIADTPIRIRHHCIEMTADHLINKPFGKWSIKEHIGHLISVEHLHTLRLKEFIEFKKELSAADLTNRKTFDIQFNGWPIAELCEEFERKRREFLAMYDKMDHACHLHGSFHPRLKVLMKPIDMLFFIAEHDDHHITSILRQEEGKEY